MGPVFATRLTILPDDACTSEQLHDRVVGLCHKWLWDLGQKVGLAVGTDPAQSEDVGDPKGTTHLRAHHLLVGETRAWRAVMLHPYSSDGLRDHEIGMRIELQARAEDSEEVLTVRILLGSLFDRVQPLAYDLKVPGIVKAIAQSFANVSIGNLAVDMAPRYLSEAEIDGLPDRILRRNRQAPMIVVSRTQSEDLLVSPEAIAEAVVGLGRVYVLPSFKSAYKLTNAFDRGLSCHSGAVRVYWPQFTRYDNQYRHPLWINSRLKTDDLGKRLPEVIFGMLAAASAIGIGSDVQTWNLYQTDEQARTQRMIDRAKAVAESRANATEQDFFDIVADMETLEAERQRAEEMIYALEAENMALRYAQSGSQKESAVSNISDFIATVQSARSVADIVGFLQEAADPACIEFLPDALSSAEEGHFGNDLSIAWESFRKLLTGAHLFHYEDGSRLQDVMYRAGATEHQFGADTSDTVRNTHYHLYHRRYRRRGKEQMVPMGPHLKNGKGNANFSLYLYWYVDDLDRRFVVGHVGRKLKDSTGGYG